MKAGKLYSCKNFVPIRMAIHGVYECRSARWRRWWWLNSTEGRPSWTGIFSGIEHRQQERELPQGWSLWRPTPVCSIGSSAGAALLPRYQCHRSVARRHHLPHSPPITTTDHNAGDETDQQHMRDYHNLSILSIARISKYTYIWELVTSFSFTGRGLAISELQNSVFNWLTSF
jgi:hypothetical protein